ncbi:MAG: hypothetical protein P1V20_23640 [Verrucomicrobiales bacterium]|nr:hypothetical protein [Verrucomicrobiales bacterium]
MLAFTSYARANEPCRICVVDKENGYPVPLVELKTVHNVTFYTDNAGVVAFDLPELMGQETWFTVTADGYERKPDRFGFHGVRITPRPGERHEVTITRTSIAKRLGRITGAGIYGESRKSGEHVDWAESGVLGSDSIQSAVHGGKRYWFWGDTKLARYPLGLFHMTGATTPLQPLDHFTPPLKLNLTYFRDGKGVVRNVANLAPDDPGPTWISGCTSVSDREGVKHLVGCYSKITPPLSSYRVGLCEWQEETGNFESIRVLWQKADGKSRPDLLPVGHPVFYRDEQDKDWLLFGDPFPSMRMKSSYESWSDPSQWETVKTPKYVLDAKGNKIQPHRGSVVWSSFRKRWITIFTQQNGSPSYLGEVWYAEAGSPLGPWGTAVKVLSHRVYTFYNPKIHIGMTPADSPVLLFEGTYAQTFSNAKFPTPRHDYNQILYRLDLDDPGLAEALSSE